jgi:hypothetical protein
MSTDCEDRPRVSVWLLPAHHARISLASPEASRRRSPALFRLPTASALTPIRRHAIRFSLFLLALLTVLAQACLPAVALPPDSARPLHRYADDPRLDQKISVTAWAEPLEDLLGRLGRETGVKLRFQGRDVGDQRVNLVLKDQPLGRVQALLAETLDLCWLREGSAPGYRYVLFQDARGHKGEETLRERSRDQYADGLRRLVASLKLGPSEIEALRTQNPSWAAWLSQPARRLAIGFLGRLSDAQWRQLLETGNLQLSYDRMTPEEQGLARQYVEQSNKDRDARDLERGTPGRHHIGDLSQSGGKFGLSVFGGVPAGPDCTLDFGADPADGHVGGHGLGLGYTNEDLRRLRTRNTPPAFQRDERWQPAPEDGRHVTVTWKTKPERWEEVLRAVVRNADLQVVSDSFLYHWWEWNMDLPDVAALKDRPLAEVLDRVSEPFLYVWRREGEVLLFRNRNWYLEKKHNVPERDLRRWQAHLENGGRLTLADLAEMSQLTDRQLRNLAWAWVPIDAVRAHGDLLKLYAGLFPFQRARLETTGLLARELNAGQLALLRDWKAADGAGPEARLRVRREPVAVVFRLETGAPASREERVELERRPTAPGP